MKKIIIPVVLLVLLIFTVAIVAHKDNKYVSDNYKDFRIIDYTLDTKKYRLLVADNPEKWQKGLMFFRSLEGADGMIFIFPDSSVRTFWNKNTLMDLKLLWVQEGKKIGESNLPSIEKSKGIVTVSSPAPADTVIELEIK